VRANKLHSAKAAAAEPSVTEGYQCQAETQPRSVIARASVLWGDPPNMVSTKSRVLYLIEINLSQFRLS